MLRVLKLAAITCILCVLLSSVSTKPLSANGSSQTQISSSDALAKTKMTPSLTTDSADEVIESDNKQQERYYHPAEDRKPRVIEEFNYQNLDGSYEYKYILSNGVTRYEKTFWKRVGKGQKFLARKGFYSHPLTNHKYLTVFYTADEHGFQQDTAKYTKAVPTLPKHLEIPQQEFPDETSTIITTTTTTRKPKTTRQITSRKPQVTTTQPTIVKPSNFNWIY